MELLRRVCPGLMKDEGSKDDHLVVVVVRGGWGEGGPGAPPQGPAAPTHHQGGVNLQFSRMKI